MSLVVFGGLVYKNEGNKLMGISRDPSEVFIHKTLVDNDPKDLISFSSSPQETYFEVVIHPNESWKEPKPDKVLVTRKYSKLLELKERDCVVFFNAGIPTLFRIDDFEKKKIIGHNLTTEKFMTITNDDIDALETMQKKSCYIPYIKDDSAYTMLMGHPRKVNKTPRRSPPGTPTRSFTSPGRFMSMFTRNYSKPRSPKPPKQYVVPPQVVPHHQLPVDEFRGSSFAIHPKYAQIDTSMRPSMSRKRSPWYRRLFRGTRKYLS